MRAIDSTILLTFFQPTVKVPNDEHGKPITAPYARVSHLIETLEKEKARLIVPTPVLAEVLVRATPDQFHEIVTILDRHVVFRIEGFDVRAAEELAILTREELVGSA